VKYLGLTLNSRWRFGAHFDLLVPRVDKAALRRLLPNLGGPEERVRGLYVGVVRSMTLHGSPVWARDLTANMLRHVERKLAVRVARARIARRPTRRRQLWRGLYRLTSWRRGTPTYMGVTNNSVGRGWPHLS
ncbi:hypothetical protein WH47_10775, partial [Habropoda laboriosa]